MLPMKTMDIIWRPAGTPVANEMAIKYNTCHLPSLPSLPRASSNSICVARMSAEKTLHCQGHCLQERHAV